MIPNKVKLFSAFLILVLALPLTAAIRLDLPVRTRPQASAQSDVLKFVDVNSLLMFATNYGNFAYDASKRFTRNDGLYFPFTSIVDIESGANAKHVIFDAGLWIGAKDSVTNELLVTVAEYSTEYQVGNMRDSTFITGADVDPAVRTYTLTADSMASNPGADYNGWPVDQGAPVDDSGHPAILGDKMLWSVYNDADTSRHSNNAGKTNPLGVEIQQSTFAFRLNGALGNVAFLRYKIKNKGTHVLKNMYVSLWSDPDLGGATDDLVGCDSLAHLGYCYNGTNNDAIYGAFPPCVGMDFFQGPLQYTGNPTDTGIMWFKHYPGYVNLPMSSFNKYINGTDPKQATQTYNFMQGLNADGSTYTYNGSPTKFFVSGDPTVPPSGTGDLDNSPADRRMMLTTGPFSFRPGDSTEIIAAVIVGQGTDRLKSITVMKQFDQSAKIAYKRFFNLPRPPVQPIVKAGQLDGAISLTWSDTSEVDHRDFPFVGYTVSQGKVINGFMTWKQLANYDDPNTGGNLYDSVPDPNIAGLYYWQIVKYGGRTGLKRFFVATKDAFTGNNLKDASDYTFRVDAYSYDITAPTFLAGKLLTSSTILNVTPQKPVAGGHLVVPHANDALPTTHPTGKADVVVNPVVLDPTKSATDQYRVTFVVQPDTTINFNPAAYDTVFNYVTTPNICFILPPNFDTVRCVDTTIEAIDTTAASVDTTIVDNTYWKLEDLTKATVLFNHMLLTSTPDSSTKIFDGIQLRLNGASGLKPGEPGAPDSGWSVPNGTRRFTQLGGGDGFGLEGFRAAAGWWSPYFFFTGLHDVAPSLLVNIQLRLATTDTLGIFNPNDSNVSFGYRYGRNFANPPAKPEFAPFIIHAVGGYSFQDFTKSVPLSAWNMETNPPTRLAVGFLENNTDSGLVDGHYWPPYYNNGPDNTSSTGSREWLFIFNKPYSETADPSVEVTASANPIDIMYTAMWTRRDPDGWTAGDQFDLFANHPALATDTFLFSGSALTVSKSASALDNVRAVPNPYYLFSRYDTDVSHRQIRFTNLPQQCTIWIYNLAGDRVAQIDKNSTDSWAKWNVETSNGIPVASGIYLYVVDAPGYGQKTGKLAVFTETEQLKTY